MWESVKKWTKILVENCSPKKRRFSAQTGHRDNFRRIIASSWVRHCSDNTFLKEKKKETKCLENIKSIETLKVRKMSIQPRC